MLPITMPLFMWSQNQSTSIVLIVYLVSAVNASGQKLLRINQRKAETVGNDKSSAGVHFERCTPAFLRFNKTQTFHKRRKNIDGL